MLSSAQKKKFIFIRDTERTVVAIALESIVILPCCRHKSTVATI